MVTEKEMEAFEFDKYMIGRAQAVRLKCLDCCGFVNKEVKMCTCKNCPLYPYRMGYPERLPRKTLPMALKLARKRIPELEREEKESQKKAKKYY